MRRAWLIAGFAASVAVLLAALIWILALARRLEAGEAEARRHAAREERVRLALWRMDSALAAFLAFENASPVDPPDGRPADPPWVGGRFELAARAGEAAPAGAPTAPDGLDPERLLALLGQPALGVPVPPPGAATGEVHASAPPADLAARSASPVQRSKAPIVLEEEMSQRAANTVEYVQRQKVAGQQSSFVPPPIPAPGSPEVEAPGPGAAATAAVPTGDDAGVPAPAGGDGPDPTGGDGWTGVVRALEPVWVDGRLLLVRRVVRDGTESLQGIAFDDTALRAWLLGEVRDLLPAGDLEPVPAGEPSDPGRRLALLPWRLEPGPVPPEIDNGGRPSVRLGLTLAAGAIVVVAATAGLLLLAGLRLARRRTEFASAVIHELRTPLTTFRVYTDLLAEEMVTEEERPGYLATLRREADRLGHLVENVLAFARLERRRPPAAPRVMLAPALRAAAERLARRAAEAGHELEVTIAPQAEEVEAAIDPLTLERILDNLCDNSCRYGRGGAEAPLELSAALDRGQAVVRWRDHGPGIARAARRRLFRPFQRAAGGGDPAAAAGVGLGLALSRRLARRSGGDLRFIEPPGGGAAFELRLPVVGRSGAVSPPAAGSV
jgi:signal transduction histidine kinase